MPDCSSLVRDQAFAIPAKVLNAGPIRAYQGFLTPIRRLVHSIGFWAPSSILLLLEREGADGDLTQCGLNSPLWVLIDKCCQPFFRDLIDKVDVMLRPCHRI